MNLNKCSTPRFKSIIEESLFILIVYSWSLADTWSRDPTYERERVQYIIKTKTTLGKARQIQSCLKRGVICTQEFMYIVDLDNSVFES